MIMQEQTQYFLVHSDLIVIIKIILLNFLIEKAHVIVSIDILNQNPE